MSDLTVKTSDTILEALGIELVEISDDKVVATMPVHGPTRQPYGILHGGASVVLAETIASVGTGNLINRETHAAVGLEINANHIKSKKDGLITGTGVPLHKGRTTMVWDVRLTDEAGKLICVSRCTVAVVPIAGR
ncbi:hotdog fold thioesterase [Alicyclobacillus tolerans]|uniref:hotdog fold thioesterase n=1 Tax=Alicyclobacillus tolerans TaxID=90970 RepID=UPI001F002CBF|nr:hotdog fold thioesterase [Alicyclobacillus tolerans]MCF8565227.1 hotdog fold thioesterase [Alicyclobacillus tolerans]